MLSALRDDSMIHFFGMYVEHVQDRARTVYRDTFMRYRCVEVLEVGNLGRQPSHIPDAMDPISIEAFTWSMQHS